MENIKTLNAFSLTEVLVTMFIIILLIIASAPMITKKNAKNKNPHGVWECYLDENGRHYSKTTLDGQSSTSKSEGDYCIFKPQKNAKIYTVMVIGGGGGGASGTSFAVDAASYGTSVAYTAEADGDYKILVIGGGGGGSASIPPYGNYGGGAGGVKYAEKTLHKGDLCTLEAGMGGIEGGSVDPNVESEATNEDGTSCTGTSWKDICLGKDGHSSRFYLYGNSSTAIEATGGKGGGKSKAGDPGSDNCGSKAKGSGTNGGVLFANTGCTYAEEFMKSTGINTYNTLTYGHGGDGSSTEKAYPGRNGVVLLISGSHHSGGGGKRGATAYTTLNKITDEVKVYVGKGGAGAVTEDTNGEQGQNTAFGYYITAKGGEGGKIRYKSAGADNNALEGEEGGMSPYGGKLSGGGTSCSTSDLNGENNMNNATITNKDTMGHQKAEANEYGAGGGGGSSFSRTSETCSIDRKWGQGGRGMPGYVRVEWN